MTSQEMPQLELESVVGFGGKVPNGLLCHPDGVHLIYPLGSTIVVKNTVMGTQTFLKGHSNMVSCMKLSRDGTKLASGQVCVLLQCLVVFPIFKCRFLVQRYSIMCECGLLL